MTQYILLIQRNAKSEPRPEEWNRFLAAAQKSGLFQGGSAIGERVILGDVESAKSSDHIAGFMRFSSDDKMSILNLLQQHPVLVHGGSVELCEMIKS
jgi:hypothetical protein